MTQDRTTIYCKGTIPGTSRRCGAKLCETDGANILIQLADGRDLVITPRKGCSVSCPRCEYENVLNVKSDSDAKVLAPQTASVLSFE